MRYSQLKRLRLRHPQRELVTRIDNRRSDDLCHDLARPKEDRTMTSGRDGASHNSPILVTDEAKRWLGDLLPPLREFYAKLGHRNITETELALEVERRFGDQLMQKVCIPHGLFTGARLLIAISALSLRLSPERRRRRARAAGARRASETCCPCRGI